MDGDGTSAFAIDSATGAITVSDSGDLDFENAVNTFALTVQVSDGELSDTAVITVNLTDVDEAGNDAPVAQDATFSIAENSLLGTAIGTVSATDPDAGDVLTYSITAGNTDVDGDGTSAFAIDSTTGAITVSDSSDLNFENAVNTFALTVQVSDGELTDTAAVTINLSNINEAPSITSAATATIAENTTTGVVLAIEVEDPENNAINFVLAGVDADLFTISDQGEITFDQSPNFETPLDDNTDNQYEVQVSVSDGVNDPVTQDITIVVTNVNEAPTANDDTLSIFQESSGSLNPLANDRDVDGNTITIASKTDGEYGTVGISGNTLSYTPVDNFVGEDTFTYTITDGFLQDTATVTVTVTARNGQASDGEIIPPAQIVPIESGDDLLPAEARSRGGANALDDVIDRLAYEVPENVAGTRVQQALQNALNQTDAAFNNLFGLYQVDDLTGAVNGVLPGASGYASAALANDNIVTDFIVRVGGSGNGNATLGNFVINGGNIYVPFVIANGGNFSGTLSQAIASFFAANPGNQAATAQNFTTLPVAYFGFGEANPDGAVHLKSFGSNTFGFEDLPAGVGVSDYDFNDAVFSFGFSA